MTLFQLFDISFYVVGISLIIRKRELILVYLPFLLFLRTLAGPELFFRAAFYYAFVIAILLFLLYRAFSFSGRKIWLAGLLLLYFTGLFFFNNHSVEETRSVYMSLASLFVAIMVAPSIFAKYGLEIILRELYRMSAWVIYLFIPYVILLTILDVHPMPMYDSLRYVSNGYIYSADLHILPIVAFIYSFYRLRNNSINSLAYVSIAITSVLVALMFRRAAIFVLVMGLVSAFLYVEKSGGISKTLKAIFLGTAFFGVAFFFTYEIILEGFALRAESLGQAISTEEGRFVDHVLVYEDMFHHRAYSWLIGYSFFDAPGNYGQGIFKLRNLHADLPVIAHASGMIGLVLYLWLVVKLFINSYHKNNILIWLFLVVAFTVFTLTGRITIPAYSISYFLLLIWTTMPSIAVIKYEKK